MTLETKEPEIEEAKATKYYEYVCSECKATDVLKLNPNEPIPPAANCWNCKAGRNYQTSHEQMAGGSGMFVKREVPESEYKSPFEKSIGNNAISTQQ